jgi:hypothetical protein
VEGTIDSVWTCERVRSRHTHTHTHTHTHKHTQTHTNTHKHTHTHTHTRSHTHTHTHLGGARDGEEAIALLLRCSLKEIALLLRIKDQGSRIKDQGSTSLIDDELADDAVFTVTPQLPSTNCNVHMRRRIHLCHMRRRIHACHMMQSASQLLSRSPPQMV